MLAFNRGRPSPTQLIDYPLSSTYKSATPDYLLSSNYNPAPLETYPLNYGQPARMCEGYVFLGTTGRYRLLVVSPLTTLWQIHTRRQARATYRRQATIQRSAQTGQLVSVNGLRCGLSALVHALIQRLQGIPVSVCAKQQTTPQREPVLQTGPTYRQS